MLAEPGLVSLQALLDVVAGLETGGLHLGDLLVELGEPGVLVRAGLLAVGAPHDEAPSGPVERVVPAELREQLVPHPGQVDAHRFLGHVEDRGDLVLLHVQAPAEHRDRVLSLRQAPDDLPASFQHDRRERLLQRIDLDLPVEQLDPRQPVAEGRLTSEAVHCDIGHGPVQPVAPLFVGPALQLLPGHGRGLEGSLNEIMGQRLVAAGQHAGTPEEVAGMGPEACLQLLSLVRWNLPHAHHPPPCP